MENCDGRYSFMVAAQDVSEVFALGDISRPADNMQWAKVSS